MSTCSIKSRSKMMWRQIINLGVTASGASIGAGVGLADKFPGAHRAQICSEKISGDDYNTRK